MIEGLTGEVFDSVMRAGKPKMIGAALILFSIIVGAGGVILIAVGGYLSLCQSFSSWISGLIVGGIIVTASLVGLITAKMIMSSGESNRKIESVEKESDHGQSGNQVENAAYLGEVIGANLSRKGIGTMDVIFAALAAGTVLRAGPALRTRRRYRRKD